jgi:guanylate kinase
MREGEVEGRDYYFVSDAEFDRLIADDGLLEHATVYGHRSGVPKAPIAEALARGEDVLMRVDVQGAATIKRLVPQAVLIFLTPPSFEELEQRLRERAQDDEAALQRRLEKAASEFEQLPTFDYLVLNERDRLDAAADRVLAIMAAERCRVGRERVRV